MRSAWFAVSPRIQVILLGRLRVVCLMMMTCIPLTMIYTVVVAPSRVVTSFSAVAVAIATTTYVALRRAAFPVHLAPALLALHWSAGAACVVAGYAVYHHAGWTSLIVVLIIINGTIQISRAYVVLPLIVAGVAWLIIASTLNELGMQSVIALIALALGGLAYSTNVVFVKDVETLRELAEARSAELAQALAETQREMSERARAEQDRERLREQLIEAQKMESIGTLAGGLAHDMNNVLGGILCLAELVREASTGESVRADLDGIIAACQRGGEMTRNLVAFSRRGAYRKERIDLEQVTRQVIGILSRSAPKRIRITLQHTGKLEVDGDAAQLGQALFNLCLNSIDAIELEGEIAVRLTAVHFTDGAAPDELPAGDYVAISVADTGAGMSEATRKRIFEPFFTTKAQGRGTGLGMAMVYGTVQSHNGTIVVDSELGRGTTVTCYIPVATLPVKRVSSPATPTRPGRGRVLVVDDEPIIRATTKRTLERQGYEVLEAESGVQALERFRDHRDVAVVVLDMLMPEMGGAECFRELRALDPQVRVLLVSGYAIQDETRECLQDGACGFLSKPYSSSTLAEAVAAVARGDLLPLLEA